jgi:hypothetical protein
MNPVGVVIARYLPGGQLQRAFQLDGTYISTEIYVSTGPEGDFYITGNFSEQLVFGNKTFDAGQFNQDIYLARYDATCNLNWARHAYSAASDQVVGIETDPLGNVYLTGHYLDTIQFDQLTLLYTLCCGSREIFIVNYSAAGDVLWGEQITGTRANIQSMAMSMQGELHLSGLFSEDVILGPLKLSNWDGFQNYVTCLQTGAVTSVSQVPGIPGSRVFPNPAKEKIRILTPLKDAQYEYQVYNINGSMVSSGRINSDPYIDISFLPSGLYILRLNSIENRFTESCLFTRY